MWPDTKQLGQVASPRNPRSSRGFEKFPIRRGLGSFPRQLPPPHRHRHRSRRFPSSAPRRSAVGMRSDAHTTLRRRDAARRRPCLRGPSRRCTAGPHQEPIPQCVPPPRQVGLSNHRQRLCEFGANDQPHPYQHGTALQTGNSPEHGQELLGIRRSAARCLRSLCPCTPGSCWMQIPAGQNALKPRSLDK